MTAVIESVRPLSDGRPTALFVFHKLRADGGRLTKFWLGRLRAFADAGWATHAALISKDAQLEATIDRLVQDGRMPADTVVHHYALRDRRIRPSWFAPLGPDGSIDPRVGDWLDWLTTQVPGAVVIADSPAAFPYLAHMTNPLVARVAGIHLNHLSRSAIDLDPAATPMTPRFAERFEDCWQAFDALVVMTEAQAADLRARFGPDTPTKVIPALIDPPTSESNVGRSETTGSRIVAVGPLEDAARHAHALRAAAPALRADLTLGLDIVGEGELAGQLADLAAELGVEQQVRFLPTPDDEHSPFADARLTLWTGKRESCPLSIIRSLAAGVPVVAYDVRYGPAELLADPTLGTLVASGDVAALEQAIADRLAQQTDTDEFGQAAAPVVQRTDPAEVGAQWTALAADLSHRAFRSEAPAVLVESVNASSRVLRLPGALASSSAALGSWMCELPGQAEPAGRLVVTSASGPADDEHEPLTIRLLKRAAAPFRSGPTGRGARKLPVREVVVQLRSPALATEATESGHPYRIEFTDGSTSVPLLSAGFETRPIASRVGNALLSRHPDGTVWVEPLHEFLQGVNEDGGILARHTPEGPASDVTHAVHWGVDLDWADLRPSEQGATFSGMLRAACIIPADDAPPAICVTDVGGFARVVGQLHYRTDPTIEGLTWSVPVEGVIRVDPLVATAQLARRAIALQIGMPGLLTPVGTLRSHGDRSLVRLSCPRGDVTLLPSPGGRVLAAPGRGYRAVAGTTIRSTAAAVGSAVRRG